MKKLTIIGILLLWIWTGSLAARERVVIGGSGSLNDEMQDLAKVYMANHPLDSIQVLSESMSSTGGIEGVKAGRLSIGLVAREPRGTDRRTLVYRALARSAVAFAVHKSLPISNLSDSQACDIFSGRVRSWRDVGGSDLKIMVLTRKKDDANTETVRANMVCFKDLQITTAAITLERGSEVLDGLNNRPGTVGIVNVGSSLTERQNVKTLALGGVLPSAETVQNGKYALYGERGIVTRGVPEGAVKRFLDFVDSPAGQKVLSRRGIIPVK